MTTPTMNVTQPHTFEVEKVAWNDRGGFVGQVTVNGETLTTEQRPTNEEAMAELMELLTDHLTDTAKWYWVNWEDNRRAL